MKATSKEKSQPFQKVVLATVLLLFALLIWREFTTTSSGPRARLGHATTPRAVPSVKVDLQGANGSLRSPVSGETSPGLALEITPTAIENAFIRVVDAQGNTVSGVPVIGYTGADVVDIGTSDERGVLRTWLSPSVRRIQAVSMSGTSSSVNVALASPTLPTSPDAGGLPPGVGPELEDNHFKESDSSTAKRSYTLVLLPSGALRVQVLREHDHVPIPGVRVAVLQPAEFVAVPLGPQACASHATPGQGVTDEYGIAVLYGIPEQAKFFLAAAGGGYAAVAGDGLIGRGGRTTRPANDALITLYAAKVNCARVVLREAAEAAVVHLNGGELRDCIGSALRDRHPDSMLIKDQPTLLLLGFAGVLAEHWALGECALAFVTKEHHEHPWTAGIDVMHDVCGVIRGELHFAATAGDAIESCLEATAHPASVGSIVLLQDHGYVSKNFVFVNSTSTDENRITLQSKDDPRSVLRLPWIKSRAPVSTLGSIPCGRYVLRLTGDDGEFLRLDGMRNEIEIEVLPGESVEVTIPQQSGGGVRIAPMDAFGQLLDGPLKIGLLSPTEVAGEFTGAYYTFLEGPYQLGPVADGEFVLHVVGARPNDSDLTVPWATAHIDIRNAEVLEVAVTMAER